MGAILLWSLNLDVMCKSVSKWRPFHFINYLSRLQTMTVARPTFMYRSSYFLICLFSLSIKIVALTYITVCTRLLCFFKFVIIIWLLREKVSFLSLADKIVGLGSPKTSTLYKQQNNLHKQTCSKGNSTLL